MKSKVRIGCSSAFWGDSVAAARQLVKQASIDYLVADYLAEVTMGILAKRRKATGTQMGGAGEGGYVAEFVTFVWKPLMKDILEKNIKVVTNAGGLNPLACKAAIEKAAQDAGLPVPKVAAVFGDDLMPTKDDLLARNTFQPFKPVDEGAPEEFIPKDKNVLSLNAYIGATAVLEALNDGAQIVVTGRCVDSAVVLGPLMHEFQWKVTDYDKLASGSLAGHIIECGCQATGGNFTDWKQSAYSKNGGWSNMGYPIVEVYPDGHFLVTKPENTGGLVTRFTVGEQMIYEVLDPANYYLPDVILDMTQVKLEQIKEDVVSVSGAKGKPPTDLYKVSGVYVDGYKMSAELLIGGADAAQKSEEVAKAILTRCRRMLKRFQLDDFRETNIEMLGSEHTYGPTSRVKHTREVVLRMTVHHNDKNALRIFGMEVAPAATCMAPGITGAGGGRPHPTSQLVHVSCLVPKNNVTIKVAVGSTEPRTHTIPSHNYIAPSAKRSVGQVLKGGNDLKNTKKVPLIQLCVGRSGDKGDNTNVGLIVRDRKYWDIIVKQVTEEVISNHMGHLVKGTVKRYELPGVGALNFVLTKSLGGGGLSSLQIDRQGKTYAQMVLTGVFVDVPKEWTFPVDEEKKSKL